MPSVVFWEYVSGGTAQYRCRTPGGALARLGWDVTYVEDFDSSLDADVVVFQRVIADWIPDTIRNLKAARPDTLIVYDIDDWFDAIPDYNPASEYVANPATSLAYCHEAMQLADLITVSTPALAELYGRFAPTAVLPNYLDPEVWTRNETYKLASQGVKVGWMAAWKWRGGDADVLRPWLADFLASHEVTFGALGCPELLHDFKVSGFSLPMCSYLHLPQMLGTIDIGLVPLEYNTFNWRGKSAIKAMEYNAMGIPAIASASEANRAYITPGVNGLLVRKNNWTACIEAVMADLPAYRERAFKYAQDFYIDAHIQRWVDAYSEGRARRHIGSRRAVSAAVS